MSSSWREQPIRRVLAVRLDSLGDVLMTGPSFRAIKETFKDSHLTLLTSDSGSEAAALLPEVDECWTYNAPWLKGTPKNPSGVDSEIVKKIENGAFDAAIIFTVFSQNPLPSAL